MTPMRWLQRLGIYALLERVGFWKLIPGRLGAMLTLVPEPKASPPESGFPKFLPAKGRRRAKVAFFVGLRGGRHVSRNPLGDTPRSPGERL